MHATDDGCLRQMTNPKSRTGPVCNAKISWRVRELFSSQPAAESKPRADGRRGSCRVGLRAGSKSRGRSSLEEGLTCAIGLPRPLKAAIRDRHANQETA